MKTGAVILAGRPNTGALAGMGPEATEAVIEIGGRPMIASVLDAVRACPDIDEICVVGPPAALEPVVSGSGVQIVAPGESLVENVRRGVAALTRSEWAVILTSDLPLLGPEALTDFLARCDRSAARFFYPIVPRPVYERTFPGSRRTYVRLLDGVFTGGNLFLVHLPSLEPALHLVERMYALRKSPLALARFIGPGFLIRLILGRLRICDLERRLSALAGAPGRALITEYAEIGFDVDRPEDVGVAESYLKTGG